MSYVGALGNSCYSYRISEQNANLNKNMNHLRDNSGDRSFDKIDLTIKNKMEAHKKRTQSTAENILKNRFPNLNDYNKSNEAEGEDNNDERRDLIQLQKGEQKWVSKEVINEENTK